MSGEMFWLGMTVLLSMLIWIPYTALYAGISGLQSATTDTPPTSKLPDWGQRCHRAHMNLIEALVPFAILVLMLKVLGKADANTATAAAIFFFARVAHLVVYAAGIPYLRTVAFATGSLASLYLFWQLIS